MRKSKLFFLLLIMMCLLIVPSVSVMAADTSQAGSLKVSILETGTGKGIENARVSIYLVADVNSDGVTHALTSDFAGSGFELEALDKLTAAENKKKATELCSFAVERSITDTTSMLSDASGAVKFDGLKQGLYLVCQTESPDDHIPISPFLITIPQIVDGEKVYDVDAAPKTGTSVLKPTPPTPPDPVTPTDPVLPNTGQLWWPVFVMAGLGVIFCVLGFALKRVKRHE